MLIVSQYNTFDCLVRWLCLRLSYGVKSNLILQNVETDRQEHWDMALSKFNLDTGIHSISELTPSLIDVSCFEPVTQTTDCFFVMCALKFIYLQQRSINSCSEKQVFHIRQ